MGNSFVRILILLVFTLFSQARNELILDYVTELENAVDELIKKVAYLESKLEEAKLEQNSESSRNSSNCIPECDCPSEIKVIEKTVFDDSLKKDLENCRKELEDLKSSCDLIKVKQDPIPPDLLAFKKLLQRELDRYKEVLDPSTKDELQKDLESAKSFKDLSDFKSRLAALKAGKKLK